MKKYNVVFITPGPAYNIESPFYQYKFVALGEKFKGYIITSADDKKDIAIGNFLFKSIIPYVYKTDIIRKNLFLLKFILLCLVNVRNINKESSVDCIITYDPLKTGIIGCLIKIIFGIKLIVTVNGVYTSSSVWEDESNGLLNRVKKFVTPRIMRFVLSQADGVKLLFPSQVDQFADVINEVSVFPNLVPTRFFSNIEEKKEVLFVGFPFHLKGVDILIEAFRQVSPQFPEWKLKILGWYPDPTVLNHAIGDHPNIFHVPSVPYSEVPDHIGRCAFLVLPSRTEAMGRVLLEAAASGKPRIGSNVDGIPTVITDGIDGFLVEPKNVDVLAEKMALLIGDPVLREKMGMAAAERARIEFTEQKFVDNMQAFVEKIVG